MSNWDNHYEKILPYIFAIETPDGSGSGFFFAKNESGTLLAVATAAHVVAEADTWKKPIKLRHHESGKEVFLKDDERVITIDARRDAASIVIKGDIFALPSKNLPMIDADKYQPIGQEIAWVGYPGIVTPNLCFFAGRISAFIGGTDAYLIDGVAINGVSGGPVFGRHDKDTPELLGIVSAYLPNRVGGATLPGLMSAQDISPFYNTIQTLKNMDEARRKKVIEQAQTKLKHEADSGGDFQAPPAPKEEPGGKP